MIRDAREADLDAVAEMIDDFVVGHKAETHVRSRAALHEAYFGRADGAEFLHASAISDEVARLYERVAIGSESYECFVSAEAFHQLADLAGKPVREIVRGMPDPALNRVVRR